MIFCSCCIWLLLLVVSLVGCWCGLCGRLGVCCLNIGCCVSGIVCWWFVLNWMWFVRLFCS